MEERAERGNESAYSPWWGHSDEARFVPGPKAESGPDKSVEVSGEPAILCNLIEFDLDRALGILILRGDEGGWVDASSVTDCKKLASSLVRPMTTPGRVIAIRGGGEDRSGQRGLCGTTGCVFSLRREHRTVG